MNYKFTCGNCGYEFTGAWKPQHPPHCPICRANPLTKKYRVLKTKKSLRSRYVPIGLKVKIK